MDTSNNIILMIRNYKRDQNILPSNFFDSKDD